MQAYSYRDSGIEWLGKIPSHWQAKRIKDLVDLKSGDGITSLGITEEGDYPVYGGNGLRGYTSAYTHEGLLVLIGRQGALCGNVNYASGKFWASEHAVVATPIRRHDTFWLGELLRAMNLNQYSNAAAQPGLAVEKIKNLRIPLPPYDEQRAIAAYLDEACAKIDAAIQVKREQLEKLEAIGKSVLNKAVLQGLNPNVPKQQLDSVWFRELPKHWQLRRLKDVSNMQTGITLGKEYDGEVEERPYLRVANVQDGHLALEDVKTIKLPPQMIPRYELQAGDVLMNEGGDLDKLGRGHVWQAEIPGCLHQNHVFALRCFPHKLLPDYLALLTSSTHGRAYFEIMGKKTTNLASINSTKVNLFPVPLPPVEEQTEIVQWVQQQRGKLKQAQDVVSEQIAVLEAYKKSLIHECVTGKKQVWRGE